MTEWKPREYGITDNSDSTLTVWSGLFMSVFEASGRPRVGAASLTLTTYDGEKVRVKLPVGCAFPRTALNYSDIDAAINSALNAHYAPHDKVVAPPTYAPGSALDVANRVLDEHAIQPHWQRNRDQIAQLIAEGIALALKLTSDTQAVAQ